WWSTSPPSPSSRGWSRSCAPRSAGPNRAPGSRWCASGTWSDCRCAPRTGCTDTPPSWSRPDGWPTAPSLRGPSGVPGRAETGPRTRRRRPVAWKPNRGGAPMSTPEGQSTPRAMEYADAQRTAADLQERVDALTVRNTRLMETLKEARGQLHVLQEEVDRLGQPPSAYGYFIGGDAETQS